MLVHASETRAKGAFVGLTVIPATDGAMGLASAMVPLLFQHGIALAARKQVRTLAQWQRVCTRANSESAKVL
eukprot:6376429-Lingulodinium_polyedra.AAC.1